MSKRKINPSGIYFLPNLLTTAGLFAAFYSIVASLKGLYEPAVFAIFTGMIADGLDGRIARMTHTETAFGAEYDSMCDMVTFGVAPALLIYSWNLNHLGKLGWVVAFIFTAAVALRLARFNTQVSTADKRYFQGLACPAGAAVIASFVWLSYQLQWQHQLILGVSFILTGVIALLMVSNIRYYSFKELAVKEKIPFLHVLFIVILFAAIAANPALMLFIASTLYALSGPLQTLFSLNKVRQARLKKKQRKNKLDI